MLAKTYRFSSRSLLPALARARAFATPPPDCPPTAIPSYDEERGPRDVRPFDAKKGSVRDPNRLDNLFPSVEEYRAQFDQCFDEDATFQPPHAMEFPYMTYKDTAVNFHIRSRRFRPPKFSDVEYKEIESKTSLNKDSVEYVRDMWMNKDVDDIDYQMVCDDILEMYKKGVSKRTINLWLNHVTGDGEHPDESLRNLTWTRIDS